MIIKHFKKQNNNTTYDQSKQKKKEYINKIKQGEKLLQVCSV